MKNNLIIANSKAEEQINDIDYKVGGKIITDHKIERTTNITARELVSSLKPFKGSNTSASWRDGVYVVLSYAWYPLFIHKDSQWYENGDGWSNSTKKQIRQLRPAYNTQSKTLDELRSMYETTEKEDKLYNKFVK